MDALISIIIPIYKVEPYLRKCVDSVLSQTYGDFEAILVDDGSPDGCGRICDEYAAKDPRIVVIHQKNAGLSAARNAGLNIARGGWVTFLDSDDWINPTYLGSLFAATNADCPISVAIMRSTDGVRDLSIVGNELPAVVSPEEVYDKCDLLAVWACGKLFRRDLIGSLRFLDGRIQEGEFFTYQVLFKPARVSIAHDAIYYYLRRSDSIVGGKWYPGRMMAVEGMKVQLAYFEGHDFHVAARHVRCRLLRWLASAILAIRHDCPHEISTLERVKEMLHDLEANNHDLIQGDSQLEYLVSLALHPEKSVRARFRYGVRTMRQKGVVAVLHKLVKRFVR